jgi:hypothetical protein
MGVLNEVVGTVKSDMPPARDINDDATRVCQRPVADMHAFTSANEAEEEKE